MRQYRGKFARGGAIAGAVLFGLGAANAFAADGTLFLEQDDASLFFNGDVGGGEFGVYNFVNNNAGLTLQPPSATMKVNSVVNGHGPFDFQTFCVEHFEDVVFNVQLNWTANDFVERTGGVHKNLDPRTAYVFWTFWTANALTPAYNYTLGANRVNSAGTVQLAIWFFEGDSLFNGGDVGTLINSANTAVASGGSWFALTNGAGFPGNLNGVKALNLTLGATLQQDILAVFGSDVPNDPGDCEGRTPGFWHNKNGEKLVKESGAGANWSWLTTINALPLVDGTTNGHYLADVPLSAAGFDIISDFLVSGNNAKNMAQKLSQHVCAMQFNLLNGFADEDCLVYTGGNSDCVGGVDTISIGEVMDLAIQSLLDDPYTPSDGLHDEARDYQECLKNILDAANNNANWVN
jgi:hypothetical protein